MKQRPLLSIAMTLVLIGVATSDVDAQDPDSARAAQIQDEISSLQSELRSLDRAVDRLESNIEDKADFGIILFLYGVFCALWAQSTGRGPWLWFFLGLFFSVITVLFLLSKNAQDRRMTAAS